MVSTRVAILAFAVALAVVAVVAVPDNLITVEDWEAPSFHTFREWAITKKKAYMSPDFQASNYGYVNQRYNIFRANAKSFINTFNVMARESIADTREYQRVLSDLVRNMRATIRGATFSFFDNAYADHTSDEFGRTRISKNMGEPAPGPFDKHIPTRRALPESFDWRSTGSHVTQVLDQGNYGLCFGFSATQSLEGQLTKAGLKLTVLSPQTMVECDGSYIESAKQGDCSLFGGWPWVALNYLATHNGVRTWEDFRYTGNTKEGEKTIYPCMPKGYNKGFCGNHDDLYCVANGTQGQGPEQLCDPTKGRYYTKVSGYKRYGTVEEKELAQTLVDVGPLSVCLDAEMLQWYSSGIFNPPDWMCNSLNHAVLMIGYGTENGTDYWTIKNSWAETWGEKGYFRIARGVNKCGINKEIVVGQI